MHNNTITTTSNEVEQIKAQVQIIQQVMKSVMLEGEHYGVIPGTQKNSLFQTGAQKLLATFRLGSEPEVINTDETQFSVSYRVKVRLFNIADNNTVGYGIGECSSLEDKYAFRKAVSDEEFDSYPESRRRIKHYATYSVKQVATRHKDVANTILKMATKRALVGAVLTATAAGDIFTQDLEDMEPHTRDAIVSDGSSKPVNTINTNAVSLQEIRDAVKHLGHKTFMKDEDGKTLLFVAGNCYLNREILKKMGFKFRRLQGQKYGETYMDATSLVNQNSSRPSNAQASTTQPQQQPQPQEQAASQDPLGDFEEYLLSEGFIIYKDKSNKGNTFLKIEVDENNSKQIEFVMNHGFKKTSKGYVRDVTDMVLPASA